MTYSIFDNMDRCTPDEVQRLLPLVPEAQQSEALRFKHTFGQFATLKSYLMLKELLVDGQLVEPDDPLLFEYNPHGKPHLAQHPHIHFNISHCPNAIAVAIDNAPIGVDVERFVEPSESLLNYCMNADEVILVKNAEHPEQQFAALWTQKEAFFKLLGTGITHELRDILANPHPGIQIATQLFVEKSFAFTLATTITQ